jgi:hypothetical protein
MNKFLACCSLLCLLTVTTFAQRLQLSITESKQFASNQKRYDSILLTWQDFRAVTPANDGWSALTSTSASYNCNVLKSKDVVKVKYVLKFYFDRNKSSKLHNKLTNYTLQHEQLHFDIAWYNYQVFLADVKATQFTAANYSALFKHKFQAYLDAENAMQNAYDTETQHSVLQDKQQEWSAKVAQLLQSLVK